jgi:hypothetical protein
MTKLVAPSGFPWPDLPAAELVDPEKEISFEPNVIRFGYGQEEAMGISEVTPPDPYEVILRMEVKPTLPPPEKRSVTLMLRAACTGLVSEPHTVSKDTPFHTGSTVFGASSSSYEVRTITPLSEICWNIVTGGILRFPPGKEGWWPVSWFLLRREFFLPAPNEEWSFVLSRVTRETDELPGPILVRNLRLEWVPKGHAERPTL